MISPEALLEAYSKVSRVNHKILESLSLVLAAFQEQGIEVLLLKGADLLFRVYGAKGLRAMNDVDLLIPEKDLTAVDQTLKRLGYTSKIDGNPAYIDSDRTFSLDIITDIWYLNDANEIWQRAHDRSYLGAQCKVMGSEDLVLYLTAYVVVHRGCLSNAYAQDISRVLEMEPLDWEQVRKLTLQANLKIPVYYGLLFASGRGAKIPSQVLISLAPKNFKERQLLFLFQKLVTASQIRYIGHFLLWITRPQQQQGNWLKKMFFPSQAMMQYRYGEKKEASYFLLRAWRVVYLAGQAFLLTGKILVILCKPER